ncbi:MAG: hypothetical protein Q9175_002476 [Cornicularia normoerica]
MRAIRKQPDEASLIAHTVLLFGTVVAASYAGTSNLLAAHLAGASISWYDSEVAQPGVVEKSERVEATRSINESDNAKNEKWNTLDDKTNTGKHLDPPEAASTQAIQEPDGQDRETVRAQVSLSGASIYKKHEQPAARVLRLLFPASADRILSTWFKR